MKTRPDQLVNQLERLKAPLPVYMVTGDEPLQHAESCDNIRRSLRAAEFTEREVMHVDAGFAWESLLESANALSLFAERKIIELRLGNQKLDKKASGLLQRYLDNPAPDNALLIMADRLDAGAKKSAWFKQVEKTGLVVEIWPIEADQLPGWLMQRARSLGLELTSDAVQLLGSRIEGNLLAAQQEMDKLSLLYPNQKIDVEQVIEAVADSSRFDIFALSDALLQHDPARCQKILLVLRQEGVEATLVLWGISREIRTLLNVQRGLANGLAYDSLCQREKIWGKRKALVRKASQKLSAHQLEGLLILCHDIDQAIKGQLKADPWLLLSTLTLELSGCHLNQPNPIH
ncbi:DNA polymerase III subunit delta [Marinobacterium sediminicola]|uniref:DNA polymerase III subunit delta n=1 Tax=Marinobacterium sediminicola TaxID=518898 RepID=A0ABY1S0N7_9GAMM|nr:DNA polymerase III subunit delta [Marinobacterium sediminicola]ULG69645.1 DNA polymerase III subunit delta [Marinobacterium sediminicola]SMR74627.1 DNA polymerase III, delta subunit [Marinobacterium sediminicola]